MEGRRSSATKTHPSPLWGRERSWWSSAEGLSPGREPFDVLLKTFGGGSVPVESYGLLRRGDGWSPGAVIRPVIGGSHGIRGIIFVVSPNPDELRHLPVQAGRRGAAASHRSDVPRIFG
jgi:hypothetical protein